MSILYRESLLAFRAKDDPVGLSILALFSVYILTSAVVSSLFGPDNSSIFIPLTHDTFLKDNFWVFVFILGFALILFVGLLVFALQNSIIVDNEKILFREIVFSKPVEIQFDEFLRIFIYLGFSERKNLAFKAQFESEKSLGGSRPIKNPLRFFATLKSAMGEHFSSVFDSEFVFTLSSEVQNEVERIFSKKDSGKNLSGKETEVFETLTFLFGENKPQVKLWE